MNSDYIPLLDLVPEPWRSRLLFAVLLSPFIGRTYHAVVTGGGLKAIISAIWLGTNAPKGG